MKILATDGGGRGTEKFIVEMEGSELAQLIGFYSAYDDKFHVKPGMTVKVSDMYRQLYNLRGMQGVAQKAIEQVTRACELLEIIDPVIKAVVAPEEGTQTQP